MWNCDCGHLGQVSLEKEILISMEFPCFSKKLICYLSAVRLEPPKDVCPLPLPSCPLHIHFLNFPDVDDLAKVGVDTPKNLALMQPNL